LPKADERAAGILHHFLSVCENVLKRCYAVASEVVSSEPK